MTIQAPADPFTTAVAEVPSVSSATKKAAASLELLDGGEVIQLSIKPSPWCILLYSHKLLITMVLMTTALMWATRGQPSLFTSITLLTIIIFALFVVGAATLQWASQLYVLTNRRVLSFQGMFSVDVLQQPLTNIHAAQLHTTWFQPPLRLASIHMKPLSATDPNIVWEHISRPHEVHEILTRAIKKARSGSC
ncbi:MAG: PH domain-containing protein [Planctomycetota bacterium]